MTTSPLAAIALDCAISSGLPALHPDRNVQRLREKVDTLIVDKTGTLTEGKPKLMTVETSPFASVVGGAVKTEYPFEKVPNSQSLFKNSPLLNKPSLQEYLLFGNTPAAMPMVGGSKALFGTNPLAAAFPIGNKDPLVIDMSLSAVARGKLLVAAKKGERIPEGWALTAQGKPTTDPNEGLKGLMVPLGGDKGALLALMIELLVVGLSGSRFSYEADSFFDANGNRPRIGQLLMTIDPGLAGSQVFANKMQSFLKTLTYLG